MLPANEQKRQCIQHITRASGGQKKLTLPKNVLIWGWHATTPPRLSINSSTYDEFFNSVSFFLFVIRFLLFAVWVAHWRIPFHRTTYHNSAVFIYFILFFCILYSEKFTSSAAMCQRDPRGDHRNLLNSYVGVQRNGIEDVECVLL